jgi:hypothetical protein
MQRTTGDYSELRSYANQGAAAGVRIVAAERTDYVAMAAVDREAIPDAPLRPECFGRLLMRRPGRPRILGTVARDRQSDQVVGYVLYELRRRGTWFVRLAVRQPWREAQAGAALVEWLKSCHPGTARAIWAAISEHQEAGMRFLAGQGFRMLKRLPGTGLEGEDRYLYVWRREEGLSPEA